MPLTNQPIGKFYSHPVWVLNGFFSSNDQISSRHRSAIVEYVAQTKPSAVADYGGGFGELSIRLATSIPNAKIDIIEPFISVIGKYRTEKFENIEIKQNLGEGYDAIIAQDVLEHLENPLDLVIEISKRTRLGGYIIFANCFDSVIKCHLPRTFHLRHTFSWVVKRAGLEYIGTVPDASHVQVYKKVGGVEMHKLLTREKVSIVFGSLANYCEKIVGKFRG